MPNHWGLEKWKRTMLMAAKVRRPVNAFSRSGLRISTAYLDGVGGDGDAIWCRGIPSDEGMKRACRDNYSIETRGKAYLKGLKPQGNVCVNMPRINRRPTAWLMR